MGPRLIIGSRGSQLALTQSYWVRDLIAQRHPALEIHIEIISTQGDITGGSLRNFSDPGVFTSALEEALLASCIDLAVHSLKDLPTEMHDDLAVVATPVREDVRDVLVSATPTFQDLPSGARLATGSLRRRSQLAHLRPDLQFIDIRGNIDTRLAKALTGEYHGIVVAAAALHRMERREHISSYFTTSEVLPAVGQAALALQVRRDTDAAVVARTLNHLPTFTSVTAERSFLRHLGGGCHAPIAAWGRSEEGRLKLDGLVGAVDGSEILRSTIEGSVEDAVGLGACLADKLAIQGATAFLSPDAG